MTEKPKVLLLLPHPAAQLAEESRLGKQPSERLYGANELATRGWRITISDARFENRVGVLITRLKAYGFNLIDFTTIQQIRSHDIVLVKDDFSVPISLACRLFGKKLIYYDSMFQIPKKRFDRICVKYCLHHCDVVLAYSEYQIELWRETFRLSRDRFKKVPYAMDRAFYRKGLPQLSDGGYVLSVGRDTGRDFRTLVQACRKLGVRLKLITLDYLIRDIELPIDCVEVIQDVSYRELFDLYSSASAVALTLKKGISYPSGIRAALECKLIGKPLVVTETPVLREMLPESTHTFFAQAEDVDDLSRQLKNALQSSVKGAVEARELESVAASLDDLGDSLDGVLSGLS
jgi:glycosyltransferase involved in cell wall biosynthesis